MRHVLAFLLLFAIPGIAYGQDPAIKVAFRSTSGYCGSDPAGYTYGLASDVYGSNTRNGWSFGWVTGLGTPSAANRLSAQCSDGFSGINFKSGAGTFATWCADVGSAGTKEVRIAMGDPSNDQTTQKYHVLDDTTLLYTCAETVASEPRANHYIDANCGGVGNNVFHSSPSAWNTNNTAKTVTLATTKLCVKLEGTTSPALIAKIEIFGGTTTTTTLTTTTTTLPPPIKIAFRETSGYCSGTDPAGFTYGLASDVYGSNTRNGWSFGWVAGQTSGGGRDRLSGQCSSGLAGMNFKGNTGTTATWCADVAAAGDYSIRLAMGDPTFDSTDQKYELLDNTTLRYSCDDAVPSEPRANHYIDANCESRSSPNDWNAYNVARTVTLTSKLCVKIGDNSQNNNSNIARIEIAPVGGITTTTTTTSTTTTTTAVGAFAASLNFRATALNCNDPAGSTYVLQTDSYPTIRDGLTFGYLDAGSRSHVDFTASDCRFGGVVLKVNNGDPRPFQLDVPSGRTYDVRLALGTTPWATTWSQVEVLDDTSSRFSVGNQTMAGHFLDSFGNDRTSGADWLTNNQARQAQMVSTKMIFKVATPVTRGDGSSSGLTHLEVSDPTVTTSTTTTTTLAGTSAVPALVARRKLR